jgi:hypothetical protein
MKEPIGKTQNFRKNCSTLKSTSPSKVSKSLTPTKNHPLEDLENLKPAEGSFVDDSEQLLTECTYDDDVAANNNILNKISPESATYPATNLSNIKLDDEANNNINQPFVDIDEGERSPSKNNNEMPLNVNEDKHLSTGTNLTTSTDKIEGEIDSLVT